MKVRNSQIQFGKKNPNFVIVSNSNYSSHKVKFFISSNEGFKSNSFLNVI
jgi:hypothetical protein